MFRTRAGYRAPQAFFWALTVVGVVLLVLQLAQAMSAHFSADATRQFVHALLFPILPLLVLPSIVNLWVLPATHRFDAYLKAAWRGDDAQLPLADHQPEPDATTLALPVIIRLRPRWHVLLNMDVLFFLMTSLYAVAYGLTDTPPIQLGLLAASMFAIVAIMFFVLVLFTQRTAGNPVTVSEEGLSYHLPDARRSLYAIKWSEARLFAISAGRKKRPNEVIYMLAAPGPGRFVYWPRLCPPPRWHATREPTMPFAEYDQQMQALLSLVVARTGLPLRDLR